MSVRRLSIVVDVQLGYVVSMYSISAVDMRPLGIASRGPNSPKRPSFARGRGIVAYEDVRNTINAVRL